MTKNLTEKLAKKLEIVYIVPSRYDDDGYVQRWIKGVVPSNTLSVLKSLAEEMIAKKALPDVEVTLTSYDDNIEKIPIKKIAARNRKPGTHVVVGIVGVQSNQFPRASDLALRLREQGLNVLIGGFHVSGVLALFDELSVELQRLVDHGVTLLAGEAETPGVMEAVFQDALDGKLQSIYRFPKSPDLSSAPLPKADPKYVDHFGARWATIDSSRGCPFGCTFCTVINIQGRKMRCRSAQAVLDTIRVNHENGVSNFFFTDDNFARNAHWNEVFDGMIEMQAEGKKLGFMMQIDTQAAKIRGFVAKAKQAGCRMVFIGMESVNPDNIAAAGKSQNQVDQYRGMVRNWQEAGVVVHVGYIIGFPNDTMESVRRDVVFLRDHVGVDLASFFMLTPLPGSVDHLEMVRRNEELDPDLNKYDSFHETFRHPKMAPGEWQAATRMAYTEFYTKEHCTNILRRLPREHYWLMFWNLIWYRYSGVLSGTHPMMTGFFRQKDRRDRRPGMPRENMFKFAWRWVKDFVLDARSYIQLFFEFQEIWFMTRNDVPGREPIAEAIAAPETTSNIAILSQKMTSRRLEKLRNWAPLAQLKLCWNSLQQRVAEHSWSGRYDVAAQELKNALAVTAGRLREMSHNLASMMDRSKKKTAIEMDAVAAEIENCVAELNAVTAGSSPDPSVLYRAQAFVREKILAKYDELASRCVKLRRRANSLRVRALAKLERGRLLGCAATVLRQPWMGVVGPCLSFRFCLAVSRKELSCPEPKRE